MSKHEQPKNVADLGDATIEAEEYWDRVDRTNIPKGLVPAGFRPRWQREEDVPRHQIEGWELVEGAPKTMPGSVLMRLPEAKAKARAKFHERQNTTNEGRASDFAGGGPHAFKARDHVGIQHPRSGD